MTNEQSTLLPTVTAVPARPLPVFVLADTSGSMHGAKIQALQTALREMCGALGALNEPRCEVVVSVIRFGGDVEMLVPPTLARDAVVPDLSAGGGTPMGEAIEMLVRLIEDPASFPKRAFAPTVVLISDGQPTPPECVDAPLARLLGERRSARATRLAMAIGPDADHAMLRRFIANPEVPLFLARDAHRIRDFFRWVTLSVQVRTRSRLPDQAPLPPTDDLDDDDLRF